MIKARKTYVSGRWAKKVIPSRSKFLQVPKVLLRSCCSTDGNIGSKWGIGLDWKNQEAECHKGAYCHSLGVYPKKPLESFEQVRYTV